DHDRAGIGGDRCGPVCRTVVDDDDFVCGVELLPSQCGDARADSGLGIVGWDYYRNQRVSHGRLVSGPAGRGLPVMVVCHRHLAREAATKPRTIWGTTTTR